MRRVRMLGEGPHAHRFAVGVWLCAVLTLGAHPAAAQTTLTVSGSPTAMAITTAVAGAAPTAVTEATTTYTVKTSTGAKKILAHMGNNMPQGMTLQVLFAPTPGATSSLVALTNVDQTVVSNITNAVDRTATITYTFSATAVAGHVPVKTRAVTLTLVAYP